MASESTLGSLLCTVICAGVLFMSFVTRDRGGFHVNLSNANTYIVPIYIKRTGQNGGRLMPDVHGYYLW